MHVIWIPDNCKDLFDDGIYLCPMADLLVGEARRCRNYSDNYAQRMAQAGAEKGWTSSHEGNCEACGKFSRLEIHHIRPLWASAVDFLCSGILAGKTFSIVEGEAAPYQEWHDLTNLQPVCRPCHEELERGSLPSWQRILAGKYYPHLAFGHREAKRLFKQYWYQVANNGN